MLDSLTLTKKLDCVFAYHVGHISKYWFYKSGGDSRADRTLIVVVVSFVRILIDCTLFMYVCLIYSQKYYCCNANAIKLIKIGLTMIKIYFNLLIVTPQPTSNSDKFKISNN